MNHIDWAAWDAWMEANDHLVQQGIVPTPEEITRRNDMAVEQTEHDRIAAANRQFNKDVAALEEARLSYLCNE